MGILNRLFGIPVLQKAHAAQKVVMDEKDMIEVYDGYGRKMLIRKDEWRKNVLPKNIKDNWDKPEELYQNIVLALQDKFFADILKASERLLAIDKNKERSYIVRGIVLMENNRLKDAKAILQSYIDKYGETGCIMVNLAKVYAKEGNKAKEEESLWRGVQLDPNQDNGLGWWLAIQREKGGNPAYVAELKKLANINGSWRPQLWLARESLEQKDLPTALQYYKYVISKAKDVPGVLMQISGDLGKNGYYDEIFSFILPIYDPLKHDTLTGINILRAYLESKRYEDGSKFLKRMFALNRDDIRDILMDFAAQFDGKLSNLPRSFDDKQKLSAGIVVLDNPIFFYGLKGPTWFLPVINRGGAKIGFMPLANISAEKTNIIQQETHAGRLTRSIPLYISERLFFETNGYSQVFITVATDGGLVTSGTELGIDYFLEALSKSKDKIGFDYYISGTVAESSGVWEIVLSIWDCKSQQKIKSLTQKTTLEKMGNAVKSLMSDLLVLMKDRKSLLEVKPIDYYKIIGDDLVRQQLLCYGQALVQVLVLNGYGTKDTLYGERDVLRNPLDLALWARDNVLSRILFISSLVKSYSYHSDVYQEFKEYAIKLINENKNDESVVKFSPLIYRIYGMNKEFDDFEEGMGKYSEEYRNWFAKVKEMKP